MTRAPLISATLAAAVFLAGGAPAQEGESLPPLPLLTEGTADVILPDAPAPEPAAAPPAPQPEPSPEETLDEAAEALVQLLAADHGEGPPMAQCAVDLLRTRLATAVEGDDVLTAIALENELLLLCSQRQQLVLEVLATELLLASLVAGETPQETAPRAAAILPAAQTEPPPAATLDQFAGEAPAEPEPAAEPEPEPATPASPGLAWVTVLGSAGNLRAAVTAVVALDIGCPASDVALTVAGVPPRHVVVPWGQATVAGQRLAELLPATRLAHAGARTPFLWPPGPYALAAAAARIVAALVGRTARIPSCFVVHDGDLGARGRAVAAPVQLDTEGIARVVEPPLTARERACLRNGLADAERTGENG